MITRVEMLYAPAEDEANGIIIVLQATPVCLIQLPRYRGVKPFSTWGDYIRRAGLPCSPIVWRILIYGDCRKITGSFLLE